MFEPASSPKRRANALLVATIPSAMPTPIATPATAIQAKVAAASANEKVPVNTAAIAKRTQTRPDASFSNASPSRICIIRFGIGAFCATADTAIGSVGDTTAANANATPSGIAGISQ